MKFSIFSDSEPIERIKEEEILALVKPWLENARVDEINIQTSCGCYSEYTTEPCSFYITFSTQLTEKEIYALPKEGIEDALKDYLTKFTWSGCRCCQGDGDDDYSGGPFDQPPYPSVYLRPKKEK